MLPPANWIFYRNMMASDFGPSTHCAAYNCTNSRHSRRDLSFFRFPKDVYRSKHWIVKCRRPDLEAKSTKYLYENCRVCAEHFENDQFMNKTVKNRLIWTAVPTIFSDPNAPDIQEAKISEPLPVVPDCDYKMEGNGFKKKWRSLKVDEVDMKLKQSKDIEVEKPVSNFCMEIGNDDFKYLVLGEDDDAVGESEGLRIVIKEEIEDIEGCSFAVNKRENCKFEGNWRTNSTEFIWNGTQDKPNFVDEAAEKGKRPKLFQTGDFEFVLVEGNLTPSALKYVLKEVQANLMRCKKVINVKAGEKGRDADRSGFGDDKSEDTGLELKTGDTVPAHHTVLGKHSLKHENEYTNKRSRTYSSGHFEFVLVDGAFEVKEESVGEYSTSTEVDPLAD